jgi:predicted nucleotidyltransferase
MNKNDPNLLGVQLVAEALGDLRDELVLVGGCSVGLLITDTARPPIRATQDVDLVAEVSTHYEYYALAERLRERGFQEAGEVICRWRKGSLTVDVMPTDESILGFSNRWYKAAVEESLTINLPNGISVRVVSPPLLIATKLEAFHGRANGDYLHHDMEDIINLVDGRVEVLREVARSPQPLQSFIRDEIDELLADSLFVERVQWLLPPDEASTRTPLVIGRLRELAGL